MPTDTILELSETEMDGSILTDVDDDIDPIASSAEYEFREGDQDSPYIVLSSLR